MIVLQDLPKTPAQTRQGYFPNQIFVSSSVDNRDWEELKLDSYPRPPCAMGGHSP